MSEAFSCAEVHGGNLRIDQGLRLPDLEVWLFSEPQGRAEEGGDVLFLSTCDHGRVTKAYLGDVAGHGISVAPVARALERLVRDHLHDLDHTDFLRDLNEEAGDRALAGLFATMAAASYHRPNERVVYAYAGHPRMLLRPAGAPGFLALEPGYCPVPGRLLDLAIGIVPGTRYQQSAVPFGPGDLLVLYSDGWTEAPLEGGGRAGDEGLLAVADRAPTRSAQAFREGLVRGFRDDLGVAAFEDDASLVVLRGAE